MSAPRGVLSLRARLVIVVAAVFAVFSLFFFTFFSARMAAQSQKWAESRALGIAALLGSSTEAAVDFDDPVNARQQLETLASSPAAVYAVILRRDGSQLAAWHADRMTVGPASLPEGTSIRDNHIHARVEVHARGGRQATLLVGFGLADLTREQGDTLRLAALVSAAILVLGLLAAFGVGTVLINPLRKVTQVARRISDGDMSAQKQLELNRHDETGELAAAMDLMLRKLQEQMALVASMNQELEERVSDRTKELASANAELGDRLSELRTTQQQLIVADRRTSVGILAAGMAHEIFNPLSYVGSNIQYVDERIERSAAQIDDAADLRQVLSEAAQGCERIQFIVQSLKAFSRKDDAPPEPVEVRKAIDSALNLANNEIRHKAHVVQDFHAVPLVMANEVRLSQVFLNLLINAAQAIPPDAASRNEIKIGLRTGADGRVQVSFADTGTGMTPEVRARLFTPFFTTKPVGVGTGLGLSVCQGIVSALKGEIRVESELGKGSTFTVILPPSLEATTRQKAPTPMPARARGGRVLVVDDDLLVASSIRRQLAEEHEVVVTTTAKEALGHLAQGEKFDFILCDLMMPELSGMEFHAELLRSYPQLIPAVTFMTGGVFSAAARSFAELHGDRILSKPINFNALRERIRERISPL